MTPGSLPVARLPIPAFVGAWLAIACVSGCVSPRDDYEEFSKRPLTEREASVVDVQLTPCEELLTKNLSGLYYTGCRPKDSAPFALAVNQKVTPSADGKTGTFGLSFKPLNTMATTMADTVGDLVTLPETMLNSDCTYKEVIGTLTLGANANALMRDLTATDVVLRGQIQSVDRGCAELDGNVDLIMLSLQNDGDICLFIRAPEDGSLPAIEGGYACDPKSLPPR
jgi:hypothetical protein